MKRAIAGCFISGLLLFVAEGRPWRVIRYAPGHSHGITGPGSLSAWGLVALAGVVAIVATRGRWRLPVGLALAASGSAAAAGAWTARDKPIRIGIVSPVPASGAITTHLTAWPYVATLAGVLLAVTGVFVALWGPRWPALGAKYDAPAVAPDDPDLWAAQDRGEDPTATIAE